MTDMANIRFFTSVLAVDMSFKLEPLSDFELTIWVGALKRSCQSKVSVNIADVSLKVI